MKNQDTGGGFINIIILVLVALIALKFFLNWDVFDAAETEQGKSTILYIRDIFNLVWSYISAPLTFVWGKIVWPLLSLAWGNLQKFIEWGQNTYTPLT